MRTDERSDTVNDQQLLRVDEAASMLALGRSKVYELMADGSLEWVRIGRARRIPTEAVTEYVSQLRGAEAPAHEVA
jgi:excisionase family DNA binding protein